MDIRKNTDRRQLYRNSSTGSVTLTADNSLSSNVEGCKEGAPWLACGCSCPEVARARTSRGQPRLPCPGDVIQTFSLPAHTTPLSSFRRDTYEFRTLTFLQHSSPPANPPIPPQHHPAHRPRASFPRLASRHPPHDNAKLRPRTPPSAPRSPARQTPSRAD